MNFSGDSKLADSKKSKYKLNGKFTCYHVIEDVSYNSLWEGIWLSLHIFVCISISSNNLKSPCSDANSASNLHLSFTILFISCWVFISWSFQKFTRHNSWVSWTNFIDLNSVISAIEWKDEGFVIEILDFTNQSAVES